MKVAFYLNNYNYKEIDFSHPENGNPGVRGTQYMIWSLACALSRNYNDIDITLYANWIDKMPKDILCEKCNDDLEAVEKADRSKVDILVLRTSISTDKKVFERLNSVNYSCITWSHNFEDFYLAEMISKTDAIKRNICVGRQQYERLRDHAVFKKSLYIYNALTFECYDNYMRDINNHIVVYVGMLDSSKGFHRLARIWPKIVKKDKKAVLYVLGSGNLGANTKLGSLSIADDKYEKKFARYLCDKNGKIIPSVKFFGKVGGKEQREIMSKAKVGIANPTGIGETFCIVAIEFEALGIPVVSVKRYGLLDTVENGKSGLLRNTDSGLVNAIVKILNDDEMSDKMGNYGSIYVRRKFSFPTILTEWHKVLIDVYNNKKNINKLEFNYPLNQAKVIREVNRKIKKLSGLSRLPSLLEYDYVLREIYRKIRNIIR